MSEKIFKVIVRTSSGEEKVYLNIFINERLPCFEQFKQKVFVRFSDLEKSNIKIYWIDEDNDQVSIFNEEDFRVFISKCNVHKDKIFIEERKTQQSAKEVRFSNDASSTSENVAKEGPSSSAGKTECKKRLHKFVICDGCDKEIIGSRYKCLECVDYDLCKSCEGKNIHSEHPMIRFFYTIDQYNLNFERMSKLFRSRCRESKREKCPGMEREESCRRHSKHHHSKCGRDDSKKNPWGTVMKILQDFTNPNFTIESHTVTDPRESTKQADEEAPQVPENANLFNVINDISKSLGLEVVSADLYENNVKRHYEEDKKDRKEKRKEEKKKKISSRLQSKHEQKNADASNKNENEPEKTTINDGNISSGKSMIDNLQETIPEEFRIDLTTDSEKPSDDGNRSGRSSSCESSDDWDIVNEEEKNSNDASKGAIPKTQASKDNSTNTNEETTKESNTSQARTIPITIEASATATTASSTSSSSAKPTEYVFTAQFKDTSNAGPTLPPQFCAPPPLYNPPMFPPHMPQFMPQPPVVIPQPPVVIPQPPIPTPTPQSTAQESPNYKNIGEALKSHIQNHLNNKVYHPKSKVNDAVKTMLAMGFSNEGGWLTQLLDSVDGDITKAIDLLQPVTKK